MREMLEIYRHAAPQRDHSHGRLLAEIAYLEARLIAVGQTGDCAYEKSLARSYRELLVLRRQELATLGRGHRQAVTRDAFLTQAARFLQLPTDAL